MSEQFIVASCMFFRCTHTDSYFIYSLASFKNHHTHTYTHTHTTARPSFSFLFFFRFTGKSSRGFSYAPSHPPPITTSPIMESSITQTPRARRVLESFSPQLRGWSSGHPRRHSVVGYTDKTRDVNICYNCCTRWLYRRMFPIFNVCKD